MSWKEEKEGGRGWDADPGRGEVSAQLQAAPYPQCVNGHITPSRPPATAPETVGPNERKAGRAAVCIIHMHGEVYIYPHVPPHPAAATIPYARRVSGHSTQAAPSPGPPPLPPSPHSPRPQPSLDPFWRQKFLCVFERERESAHFISPVGAFHFL